MKIRITVKVIIIKDKKLLLLKHIHPNKKFEWWAFPGGALEGEETIFQGAEREAWEETGLIIKCGKVRFVRQFIDEIDKSNNLELFLTSTILSGEETIKNVCGRGKDENYIKELKYFSPEELEKIKMLPRISPHKIFSKEGGIEFMGVNRNEFEK